MENHALALQVKSLKAHFVSLNAKMMSFWIVKETVILVVLTKSFLMENVFVKQDILLIHVEFAHYHVEAVNLYSKVHVLFAP